MGGLCYEIAKREPDVRNPNAPVMVFSHVFSDSFAAIIREPFSLPNLKEGARVLYMIVFKESIQITKLDGDPSWSGGTR
jgi:hypothetical protein